MTDLLLEWKEHEDKLRQLYFYLKQREENLRYKKTQKPYSLLGELNALLYFVEEEIRLEGDYKEGLTERISFLKERTRSNDEFARKFNIPNESPIILINDYAKKVKNDIFTDFFSSDENKEDKDKGLYRIEPAFRYHKGKLHFYLEIGFNALEALLKLRHREGEFHLENPFKNVVEITLCKYLSVNKKDLENSFCKILKNYCVLTHSRIKDTCPNLGNLVRNETDLLQKLINGKSVMRD